MTGIGALLGTLDNNGMDGEVEQWATVQSVPTFGTAQVLIDGATTNASAEYSWARSGGLPQLGDRVIVRRMGKTLRIVDNYKFTNGYKGGFVNAAGAFGSGAPPNGTTGVTFQINRSGSYVFTVAMSSYATVAGSTGTGTTYIDGTLRGSGAHFINPASTHLAYVPFCFTLFLFIGTHYWYHQLSGTNVISDANDRATMDWIMY